MNLRMLYDEAYLARRAKGQPGWADADELRENLQALEQDLKCSHAPARGRALELGCGAGDLAIRLATKGYEVHGVDISPVAIEWAREKAKERNVRVHFLVGDVLRLDMYADSHFDFVLDGYCFHCITGPERPAFLRSAHRVMKHGAALYIRTMCGDISTPHLRISRELRDRFDPQSRCVVNEGGVATRYIGMPETILEEVQASGFDILCWEITPSTGQLNHMDTLAMWAARKAELAPV